jgi:hypothetical protein
MVYLGPFYSTLLLPKDIRFVKDWRDPRFCILSGDDVLELDQFAKTANITRAGRKDYTARLKYAEQHNTAPKMEAFVEERAGKCPVYYIVSVAAAERAKTGGAVTVDQKGDYAPIQETIAVALPDGRRPCVGVLADGSPCPNPALFRQATCKICTGKSAIGGKVYTHARYKKFLPERIAELYEEALSRPDLLEMDNQIAVLDAKLQTVFQETGEKNIPSWNDVLKEIERLDDPDLGPMAIANLRQYANDGALYDSKWQQVQQIMEQQRKLVDTEIRRKKELNQMIPVDRVMLLMASVADVIKRHVRDPEVLMRIKKEMAMLLNAERPERPIITIEPDPVESLVKVG